MGAKGAVATTLLAAKYTLELGNTNAFAVPSDGEAAFSHLGLPKLGDLILGGWDIVPDSYSASCATHEVVPKHLLAALSERLDRTDIYPGILTERNQTLEQLCVSERAQGRMRDLEFSTSVFTKRPFAELVKSVEYDITDFRAKHKLSQLLVVNVASTDRQTPPSNVFKSLKEFEAGLVRNDPAITSAMIYAYAAIKHGCPIVNFTPSTMMDIPALIEFAHTNKVALAGKDGKTGQTLYKSCIAAMLRHRGLKLKGWYSTNILGNRDGQVLNDPAHRATKIETKSAVLEKILGYNDFDHQIHIHYYKPRGDSKEAWDSIDFSGWFDVPMQMKIDWLGDDSVLAAPLVFDLIRWVAFFSAHGEYGILPQLAAYFKHPMGTEEYDFFRQVEWLRTHVVTRYGAYKTGQHH